MQPLGKEGVAPHQRIKSNWNEPVSWCECPQNDKTLLLSFLLCPGLSPPIKKISSNRKGYMEKKKREPSAFKEKVKANNSKEKNCVFDLGRQERVHPWQPLRSRHNLLNRSLWLCLFFDYYFFLFSCSCDPLYGLWAADLLHLRAFFDHRAYSRWGSMNLVDILQKKREREVKINWRDVPSRSYFFFFLVFYLCSNS